MRPVIYLDNNATTQVAPEVFEAMRPFLTNVYGNPSSAHSLGRNTRQAVETAREQVASLIGASDTSEIVFTSCGSESDNWAIRATLATNPEKRHIVTTEVEHEAVRNLCPLLENRGYEVTRIGVDSEGLLAIESLRNALRPDTALVSVMLANNETGAIFPIEEIGQLVRQHSQAVFHVDGVQAVGKIPIDLKASEVDLFALSGHKFHAPQGIGALYIRKGLKLNSFIIGGGQESGQRAGTSAVPNIVGLGMACALAASDEGHDRVQQLRNRLEDETLGKISNARLNGPADRSRRLPNTANISFAYVDGQNIMMQLDREGICVSTGSACHSSTREASPTLRAMDVPYPIAQGSIRFSVGRYNTAEEIERTLEVLPGIVNELVERSPYEQELADLRVRSTSARG
jgi:cysteine desulfurase